MFQSKEKPQVSFLFPFQLQRRENQREGNATFTDTRNSETPIT